MCIFAGSLFEKSRAADSGAVDKKPDGRLYESQLVTDPVQGGCICNIFRENADADRIQLGLQLFEKLRTSCDNPYLIERNASERTSLPDDLAQELFTDTG